MSAERTGHDDPVPRRLQPPRDLALEQAEIQPGLPQMILYSHNDLRTIADLAGAQETGVVHASEAIQHRSLDRNVDR